MSRLTRILWTKSASCTLSTTARSLSSDCGGSTLAEFAITVGLLLTLVIGIMGVALELYASNFVADAASSAARYAMVRGSTWSTSCGSATATGCNATSSNISTFVQSITPAGLSFSNVQVRTSWPGTTPGGFTCSNVAGNNSTGCLVKVTVSYAFSFYMPFVGQNSTTLSSTAVQTISQ